jgi:hypothetical protein
VARYQIAARPGTSSEIRRFLDIPRQESRATSRKSRPAWQRDSTVRPSKPRPKRGRPSLGLLVLALLVASTGLAVLILGVLWFVFFRT